MKDADSDLREFGFEGLWALYQEWDPARGPAADHLAEILDLAYRPHHSAWLLRTGGDSEHGQSWRSWKGKNYQLLIEEIVRSTAARLNEQLEQPLAVIGTAGLRRTDDDDPLAVLRDGLQIDYGVYGRQHPNLDILVYRPQTFELVCGVFTKTSLRERVAAAAYWRIKCAAQPIARQAKFVLVTNDEDAVLRTPRAKQRMAYSIVGGEFDATYIPSQALVETPAVRRFSRFESDLAEWGGGGGGGGG